MLKSPISTSRGCAANSVRNPSRSACSQRILYWNLSLSGACPLAKYAPMTRRVPACLLVGEAGNVLLQLLSLVMERSLHVR
jgi:hypothetical protein